jgi:hypothetical protein
MNGEITIPHFHGGRSLDSVGSLIVLELHSGFGRLTGSASAASEEAKPTSESAACAC